MKSGPNGVLADGRAAHDVAALEHQRAQPFAREVGGGDEAVVPATDDDDVVLLSHRVASTLTDSRVSKYAVPEGSEGSTRGAA